jgi:hypothetical protein
MNTSVGNYALHLVCQIVPLAKDGANLWHPEDKRAIIDGRVPTGSN